MFVKKITNRNRKTGEVYLTYRLVRSYKINGKPRHQTIIDMSTLSKIDVSQHKQLADRIDELLQNVLNTNMLPINEEVEYYAQYYYQEILKKQTDKVIIPVADSLSEEEYLSINNSDFQEVDINSFTTVNVHEIGGEWLCFQAFEELGFTKLLKEQLKFSEKDYQLAISYLTGRLLYPGSDSKMSLYLNENSGVRQLFSDNERFAQLDRKSLVKISRKLYDNKEFIETQINKNIQKALLYEPKYVLYDLTNTHFEGRMQKSQKAKHGRNKQKRNDCRQVTLGLAVDELGFTQFSRIYDGNISEGGTLMNMIDNISENVNWINKTKPVIVIDAGISKEENLIELHRKGYDYICVSRSEHQKLRKQVVEENLEEIITASGSKLKIQSFDNQIIYTSEIENNPSDNKKNKVKHIINEKLLFVKTELKKTKEDAMLENKRKKIEIELVAIQECLNKPKTDKKIETINQRIGRIKERYKLVQNCYTITLDADGEIVTNLNWTYKEKNKKETDSGTYFIRSSITEPKNELLWKLYRTIGEVEDIFRILKSDLKIRGIYHQTDENIEPHIFGCLIAVNVVNFIRYKLKKNNIHHRWGEIVRIMGTQKVSQNTVNHKNGDLIVMKKCSRPIEKVKQIYSSLKYKSVPFFMKKYTTKSM